MAKTSRRPDRASAVARQTAKTSTSPAVPAGLLASLPGPDRDAIGLFQEGMEALQRHRYDAAAKRFSALLEQFPGERALLDRSRVYLALCERELRQQPSSPKTAEEQVTAATAALNDGRDEEAEQLAHGVLDQVPDHDLALYLLAAIHARRGESDTALDWLERALDVSPDVSAQARHDADFDSLRDLEQFRHLVDAPLSAQSGARRKSTAHSDR
jgi:tetratricopeptide (TPR) repeat protein